MISQLINKIIIDDYSFNCLHEDWGADQSEFCLACNDAEKDIIFELINEDAVSLAPRGDVFETGVMNIQELFTSEGYHKIKIKLIHVHQCTQHKNSTK